MNETKPYKSVSYTDDLAQGVLSLRFFVPSLHQDFSSILIFNSHQKIEERIKMMLCQIEHVKKNLAGQDILKDVHFHINEGERAAVVGANGSGKTTLFNLIAGYEKPDHGSIHIRKGASVGYLKQSVMNIEGKRVNDLLHQSFEDCYVIEQKLRELEEKMQRANEKELESCLNKYGRLQESFQEKGGYEMTAKVQSVANGLQITDKLDQKMSSLSGGEQTKVFLGVQLLNHPDFLLLDEPTNHLDIQALEWLEQFISHYEGTILLVSHDRHFLDRTMNKIIDLEDGESTIYHCSYSQYVKEKEERLLLAFAAYEDQQKKMKKMRDTIKKLKEWANQANPPNAGLHRRAKSMEKALERIEQLKRPKIEQDKLNLDFGNNGRSGKDVYKCQNVKVQFNERTLFENLDFQLKQRERAAIVGPNGSGKSTFINSLLGRQAVDDGEITEGTGIKLGVLSQHVFLDKLEDRIIDVFRENVHVTEHQARHILAKFLFYGPDVFKKLRQLSGGERIRLKFAQLMHEGVNTLILDEPTNHLDIDSREVLEEALMAFNGTVLAVSHDRYFLNRCFPLTYFLHDQQLKRYEGNYEYASEKHQERYNS